MHLAFCFYQVKDTCKFREEHSLRGISGPARYIFSLLCFTLFKPEQKFSEQLTEGG